MTPNTEQSTQPLTGYELENRSHTELVALCRQLMTELSLRIDDGALLLDARLENQRLEAEVRQRLHELLDARRAVTDLEVRLTQQIVKTAEAQEAANTAACLMSEHAREAGQLRGENEGLRRQLTAIATYAYRCLDDYYIRQDLSNPLYTLMLTLMGVEAVRDYPAAKVQRYVINQLIGRRLQWSVERLDEYLRERGTTYGTLTFGQAAEVIRDLHMEVERGS